MDALRHGPPSAFSIHLHSVWVWVSECQTPWLAGAVGGRARGVNSETCGTLVSLPPQVSFSRRVQRSKGERADKILGESPRLRKEFSGRR